MQIINTINKEQLDGFIGTQRHSQFLQSFQWGEFQRSVGNKIFRLGVEENGGLIAAAMLIKRTLPIGMSYFYCPRGPIISVECRVSSVELLNFLFKEIKKKAKDGDAIFLRFDPIEELQITNYPGLDKRSGAGKLQITRTIDVQPSKTLILNIARPEEELLKDMHQKTRYNIRLAEKKGVRIKEGGQDDFEDFWKVMAETSARDKFRLHPKNYYREMINLNDVRLLLAKYEEKIIAGVIVSIFADMGSYIHGASSDKYRNIMAPYALQWKAIELARAAGCKYYDLNGIGEDKWPGITRFKKGFGGEEVEYPGTFDLVFNPIMYKAYKVLRRIRRLV